MAHHLLPEVERDWLDEMCNCFLIRDPREMLTSLIEFIPEPTVADTGLPQQVEVFELIRDRTGKVPPVIDGKDVLLNPPAILAKLCESLGLEFDQNMLNWPPGIRTTDGAWAASWYDKVKTTTRFATYKPKDDPVPDKLLDVLDECEALYRQLEPYKISV